MGKEEKKASVSELLRRLHQRSEARCEGYKLGLDCVAKLTEDLEPLIHHMDGDPKNNDMGNLVLLCPSCHSEVMELLSEKRRKAYVKKVVERLDKSLLATHIVRFLFDSALISPLSHIPER